VLGLPQITERACTCNFTMSQCVFVKLQVLRLHTS